MKIEEILKELQPCEYISLDRKRKKVSKKIKISNLSKKETFKEEKLNIEELMSTRYYRRGRGGAIKQVR